MADAAMADLLASETAQAKRKEEERQRKEDRRKLKVYLPLRSPQAGEGGRRWCGRGYG